MLPSISSFKYFPASDMTMFTNRFVGGQSQWQIFVRHKSLHLWKMSRFHVNIAWWLLAAGSVWANQQRTRRVQVNFHAFMTWQPKETKSNLHCLVPFSRLLDKPFSFTTIKPQKIGGFFSLCCLTTHTHHFISSGMKLPFLSKKVKELRKYQVWGFQQNQSY